MNKERLFSALELIADSTVGIAGRLAGADVQSARESVAYSPAYEADTGLSTLQTAERIQNFILSKEPRFVARFGSTELRVVLRAQGREERTSYQKAYAAFARLEPPIWLKSAHTRLGTHSGFYPITRPALDRFVRLMYESMGNIDLLGSWIDGENRLRRRFPCAEFTSLGSLSPFGSEAPWTAALAGKRVLVIHPFKQTIERQYEKRRELFSDPDFLPDFELTVIRAVQSLGTPPPEFPTWFDGLFHMHELSRKIDFDVALVGCGAYGFPLGSLIKDDGKKAIVLGGLVQLLFGIKGKRWDNSGLYNEAWVRPSEGERPDGYRGADGGAYW